MTSAETTRAPWDPYLTGSAADAPCICGCNAECHWGDNGRCENCGQCEGFGLDEEALAFRQEVAAEAGPAEESDDEGSSYPSEIERQGVELLVKRFAGLDRAEREAVAFIDVEIAAARQTVQALEARRAELVKPIHRRRDWLNGYIPALQAWAAQQLQHAKSRSIKLAYGTLKFRKSPDSIQFAEEVGESQAIEWAQTNGYFDALTIHANKTAIKRRIQETGEVVPGVVYVVGEDKFSVETTETVQ